MSAEAGHIEAALKPARIWMAVYAADYRDARAGLQREVAVRVRRRLCWHKVLLLAVAALFGLFYLSSLALYVWAWIDGAHSLALPLFAGFFQVGAPIAFGYGIVRSHRRASAALQLLVDDHATAQTLAAPLERPATGH